MQFLKTAWGGGGGGGGMRSHTVTQLRGEACRYWIKTIIQFGLLGKGSPTEGVAQIFKFAATDIITPSQKRK
jgi:hypothetical protein